MRSFETKKRRRNKEVLRNQRGKNWIGHEVKRIVSNEMDSTSQLEENEIETEAETGAQG